MKHHDIAIFVSLFSIPYFDDNLCLNPNLNDIHDDTSHLSVSVLSSPASNFQKLVAIKLYISELKYNLDVFTVQMLDED